MAQHGQAGVRPEPFGDLLLGRVCVDHGETQSPASTPTASGAAGQAGVPNRSTSM